RRRWLLFFPIFVLIVGAHLVWVSYGQESRYAATSKVIISEQQPLPANTASVGTLVPLQGLSQETIEATINDYPVLRTAAELARGDRQFVSAQFQEERYAQQIDRAQQRVRAQYGEGEGGLNQIIRTLKGSALTHGRDREIVEIDVESTDALLAMLFSWAVAEGAYQFHDEKAKESIEQFLAKLDAKKSEAEGTLATANRRLMSERQRLKISNIEDEERLILEKVYSLDDQDSALVAKIKKNDKLIQYRLQEQSFGSRDDLVDTAKLASSERVTEIKNRLFSEKLELESKVATLSPKHPDVQQARAKIRGLERQLAHAQDAVLTEKYQTFSKQTNDFIKENALFALEREVLAERRHQLSGELVSLNSKRQDFGPVLASFKEAEERVTHLRSMEKDVTWYAKGQQGAVRIYDPAIEAIPVTVNGGGYGPIALTCLMAFIFALGVVYVVEYVDTRVKSEHDIRRHLNLPLLGIIPKESHSSSLLTDAPLQCEISEKFNTAATLIQRISGELNLRSLMVCSAIAREGKTTVSVNLAIALARKGAKVVIVDGDLRISQIHKILGLQNNMGLANALDTRLVAAQALGGMMTEDEMQGRAQSAVNFVQQTQVPNLFALTSGPQTSDPVNLMESGRLNRVVAELNEEFDFVIFDTPPINKVGDALSVSQAVDGSIFVVGSGQAEQHDVMWAKHLLTNVQANILGVFLNKFAKTKGSEYYYYYYYNNDKRKRIRNRA
ncbi:MAG: polysaccharide biosynthesis tyrosine autokinase, partial [Planctomycetota bacterium]